MKTLALSLFLLTAACGVDLVEPPGELGGDVADAGTVFEPVDAGQDARTTHADWVTHCFDCAPKPPTP